jgi:hypothetical protein
VWPCVQARPFAHIHHAHAHAHEHAGGDTDERTCWLDQLVKDEAGLVRAAPTLVLEVLKTTADLDGVHAHAHAREPRTHMHTYTQGQTPLRRCGRTFPPTRACLGTVMTRT